MMLAVVVRMLAGHHPDSQRGVRAEVHALLLSTQPNSSSRSSSATTSATCKPQYYQGKARLHRKANCSMIPYIHKSHHHSSKGGGQKLMQRT
jgi:hypothetical protein